MPTFVLNSDDGNQFYYDSNEDETHILNTTIKDSEIESQITFINQNYFSWLQDPYPDSPDVRNLIAKLVISIVSVSLLINLGYCAIKFIIKTLCGLPNDDDYVKFIDEYNKL